MRDAFPYKIVFMVYSYKAARKEGKGSFYWQAVADSKQEWYS